MGACERFGWVDMQAWSQGKVFKVFLCGNNIWSCSSCRTHLAKHDQIVSKVCLQDRLTLPYTRITADSRSFLPQAFQGRHGHAFLFSNV